ncbi:MAG: hypothetical protein LW693_14485 [Saprospiraceae bacterium]|nr:hypothetical protein [Saprospiraceae bacterium]
MHGAKQLTLLGNQNIVVRKYTVNIKNKGLHSLHFIENMYQFDVYLIIGPKLGDLVLR